MKKFLAVLLVLGLAGSASAVVSMSVPSEVAIGTTSTLVVSSDSVDNYGGYIVITDMVAGTFTNIQILPGTGPDADAEDLSADYPGWWFFQALSTNPEVPVVPGDHFTIDYTANDDFSLVLIELYDFSENLTGTAEIQNTPEPLTLGLLGLGGLFLRRRK